MGHWTELEIARFVTMNKMSYHVHNEFLEVAVEQGVIGLLVFVALMVAAMYYAYLIAVNAGSAHERWHGLCLLAAVVAVSVDSFFNFDLQTPAAALLFWVVVGLIAASVSRAPRGGSMRFGRSFTTTRN